MDELAVVEFAEVRSSRVSRPARTDSEPVDRVPDRAEFPRREVMRARFPRRAIESRVLVTRPAQGRIERQLARGGLVAEQG